MGSTRRRFSREFKLEAVRMVVSSGHSLAQVARELDLRPDMRRRWKRQYEQDAEQAFPGPGHLKADDEQLRQLLRENQRLREERDILKKAVAIVSLTSALRAPEPSVVATQRHSQGPAKRPDPMC